MQPLTFDDDQLILEAQRKQRIKLKQNQTISYKDVMKKRKAKRDLKRKKELEERRRLRNPEITYEENKVMYGSHHSTVLGDWYYSPRVQARLELKKKLLVEVIEDEIRNGGVDVNREKEENVNVDGIQKEEKAGDRRNGGGGDGGKDDGSWAIQRNLRKQYVDIKKG